MSRLNLDLRRLGQGLRRLPKWSLLLGGLVLVVLVGIGIWLLIQVWPEAVDETWQRILDTGVLRVCTDPSWPPFEFIDERSGEIKGLDVDLASALAARLRPTGVSMPSRSGAEWAGGSGGPEGVAIRAEIVPVGFDSLYDALAAGRCDAVLSALPYEAERTEDVAYALSYFNAGLVIVARDDSAGITGLASLPGRAVGVEWGFVPEGDGRQRLLLSDLPLRRYDTAGDALRALQAGEIDATLVDQVSALTYLHECQGLRIVGTPLTDVSYVIPVRPDAFRLLEEINRALVEIREDGTMAGLLERWF